MGRKKQWVNYSVNDYSRKGFVDGVVLRLPTVCVRPGRPNLAASSFVSSIIREPLRGEVAVCPVSRDLAFSFQPQHCNPQSHPCRYAVNRTARMENR